MDEKGRDIGRLHVLTDTVSQSRFSHCELVGLALAGGADTIQFRQKKGSTREMIATALEIRELCQRRGATLLVNDRIDVAMAAGAHGVHMGRDDFPIRKARELLGPRGVIGASASTLDEALESLDQGADYIGFGPIFPTGSKPDAGRVKGIDNLEELVAKLQVPVIAIGGIHESNTARVIRAGAHGIAVISAVCSRDDPQAATRNLWTIINREGMADKR